MNKHITKIVVATKDIVGPEGKLKKYDKYKPVTEDKIPNRTLIKIEEIKVFATCFDAAAGINNILKTKIIPTV